MSAGSIGANATTTMVVKVAATVATMLEFEECMIQLGLELSVGRNLFFSFCEGGGTDM